MVDPVGKSDVENLKMVERQSRGGIVESKQM